MAMCDGQTGQVYPPPISSSRPDRIGLAESDGSLYLPQFGNSWAELEFRVNSRLLIMSSCGDWQPNVSPGQFCFKRYRL